MTYFSDPRVAVGYAIARPFFHPLVIEQICAFLDLEGQLPRALDVGCGTGLSTVPLAALAEQTLGIDPSPAMMAAVRPQPEAQVAYQQASAEALPFAAEAVDLVTVCGAINWIDRRRFLPEARRVLRPGGWLVIYDNAIGQRMLERPGYSAWYRNRYLARYPKPPRDETPLTPTACERSGLRLFQDLN